MGMSQKQILLVAVVIACCVSVTRGWLIEPDCGGQPYDPREEMCCHRVVWTDASEDDACCGVMVYNKHKSVCCDGKIYSVKERRKC
ncbi:hypothetical protein NP493_14g07000 [Ridgeia piscesae]|uniref:Galaxin-like repeats domain-containing protein n=1 Tax=Ridgeia piscesae TaxID=27915 RepID=A0AAD9PEC2_RIDPI|nr:hypothetical protein NP493_14g07000 [Ridgeia piscesae]